jgi:hypothetical protein
MLSNYDTMLLGDPDSSNTLVALLIVARHSISEHEQPRQERFIYFLVSERMNQS